MITVPELVQHLNLPEATAEQDGDYLAGLLAAAQDHIDRTLGFKIAAAVDEGQDGFEDGLPPSLRQAALMLAAHWYEVREASAAEQLRPVPFGVSEILESFREWTF